jgi:hypothetical protein
MDQKTQKYASPSTDGVEHDVYNLIVEAMMINRYGMIPAGSWRKGSPLHLEWGEAVKIVKRLVKSMHIDARRIAWYVQRHQVERINYNEFGLVRYKINKWFRWQNLDSFHSHYKTTYNSFIREGSAYVENSSPTYKTKESGPQRKTLQQILEELENGKEE